METFGNVCDTLFINSSTAIVYMGSALICRAAIFYN